MQGVSDVDGSVADRKYFARLFAFGFNAEFVKHRNDVGGTKLADARLQKTFRVTKRLGDAFGIGVVSDVAAGAAGHQDFYARFGVFLE